MSRPTFLTNSTEPIADADITHRRHAIIESVFADLIDGSWAHMPSAHFSADRAWTILAVIARNLLRAAGTLIDTAHAVAAARPDRPTRLVVTPSPPGRPPTTSPQVGGQTTRGGGAAVRSHPI